MTLKFERMFKPCPFCANENDINVIHNQEEDFRYVHCDNCGTDGPFVKNATASNMHKTWIEAQRLWNNRV